jgi:hypothetical protein
MKSVLLTFNFNTHEVLHTVFEGEDCWKKVNNFHASMAGDFRRGEGWEHVIAHDPQALEARENAFLHDLGFDVEGEEPTQPGRHRGPGQVVL